ncbi:hypothetical protein Lal_00036116 [Lupinus albus]|uniref:Uncharacterized protein n=1 Tax=Lupinus albus TaxID=3870 RepID=A0A6A4QL41_LUPAL|nr:hypothetical protein Lalb_Chr04g0247291 [Lupinus albus]KAE9614699.1 hypothetical protein Lalb_Chr04g0247481 [Lupinus albus]KAF1868678.1 hypothetical protein Lal_00036116 [Lupinus albus]
MGRQNNDPRSVNSSIALLQERFRELEKVKERREGKEFVRLLLSSEKCVEEESRLMDPTHRPSLDDSLSLGLNLTSKKGGDHNIMKSSPPPSSLNSIDFDTSEVDTSLHL